MQLFYIPDLDPLTKSSFIDKEESRHISKVLRKKSGDLIDITNGKGFYFEGKITQISDKKCMIDIVSAEKRINPRPYFLHIAMAPTKMNDRFEWFLEKATEIGIDEITPIICDHSERKIVKQDRLEKVLISAMKQSLKFELPKINEPIKFKEFIAQERAGLKLIAHCEDEPKTEFKNLKKKQKYTVLIGPEGDFSETEIKLALEHEYIPLSLGESRLRTETAGVYVCSAISVMNS